MTVSSAFDVDAFGRRHIGTTPDDHGLMLAALGYDSLDALMSAAVPTSIRMGEVLISGWYGVYAVYQLGFSSTLRWITAGVTVP